MSKKAKILRHTIKYLTFTNYKQVLLMENNTHIVKTY